MQEQIKENEETGQNGQEESPKKQIRKKKQRRWLRWLIGCVLCIAAILLVSAPFLLSDELELTFYHLYSPKITGAENTRVVVLSDLHNR